MIRCEGVTKQFGEFRAVDRVSFEVSSGICALLGPNGAGKSTLLKLLTGLLSPDEGTVSIGGLDIGENSLAVRRLIGVVPEDLGLFDQLTVQEHLELCGPIYGIGAAETRERAEALMRVLGLAARKDAFLDRCSHGMRKKTALAMALLPNPRVLFLDEPLEGIDPVSSTAIRDLLAGAARRGITIFMTSHTLPVIEKLAADVLMMRHGRIVWRSSSGAIPAAGSLEDLYFELVESAPVENLAWLGSSPS